MELPESCRDRIFQFFGNVPSQEYRMSEMRKI